MKEGYPVWRIVLAKVAPLSEVKTWNLDEIYDANGILDMREDMKAVYTEAGKPPKKRK